VAAVVFKFPDRRYGLDENQAKYLVSQLLRRIPPIPEPIVRLIDRLEEEIRKEPNLEPSRDIILDDDEKPGLLHTLRTRPTGEQPAWNALLKRVEQDVIEAQGHV
jgi:hypothetical protein